MCTSMCLCIVRDWVCIDIPVYVLIHIFNQLIHYKLKLLIQYLESNISHVLSVPWLTFAELWVF